MVPSRNRYGIIGPIYPQEMQPETLQKKISESPLTKDKAGQKPSYCVVTNCTYDGVCYNAKEAQDLLEKTSDRLHFDEAWYGYARFNPIYADHYAMRGEPGDHNGPTVFATHSTHKLLNALSQASYIHVREGRGAINFSRFNQAYMMHATTSPLYAICASNDVAVHFLRIDWPDNAVAVAAWHHVDWFRACQHQALFDGFMAITVNDHDIVIGHASLHDGAVRAGSTDDYRPGAIGTKYACGIFFAFAKCASMVKQRTEGSSFDAHIGAEQIFSIVVMVETSGGCFGKTNAALVAWRCPGIFMDVAIFHQRAEQWRQQLLAVAGHRGNSASGDKVGGIFQNPGEFIDKLQQVAIHCGEGFFLSRR